MKNKVIFLDRDGTINVDFGYVYQKEKLFFIDGVIEGLLMFQEAGYKLIIITNQSGIGRGYYSLEQYQTFNSYFLDKLKENNVIIDAVYFCPHADEDMCNCRKPKLDLFIKAINEYNIDLENSYAIGDKERDLAICNVTSIKGILLSDVPSNKYITRSNFLDAVKFVLNNN